MYNMILNLLPFISSGINEEEFDGKLEILEKIWHYLDDDIIGRFDWFICFNTVD